MEAKQLPDTEAYRDRLATVDEQGKRVWLYPKKPAGRFFNRRANLSWVLLAILFGLPFIKSNGEPLILLNVLERKFILFGIPFMPQDFHLFVLAMLTFIVFIILFTVVWGRLFCGWGCPQTIFMEMIFRKVEYWLDGDANQQRKLDKAPWTAEKIRKKTLKHAIFFGFSVLIANTFLAYIIGLDQVVKIATEPVQLHLGGFIGMIFFSFVFYGVFARMREQVCIAICPYGRLQGVLLDKNSVAIMYDFVRGEPRGKMKKGTPRRADVETPDVLLQIRQDVSTAAAQVALAECETNGGVSLADTITGKNPALFGDCIDCKLCVQVCPTGIDIRDGTQLECINCTACIDACDEVMDKIDRPRGLIRYDSYNGVAEKRNQLWTPRVIAYSAVLLVLIIVNIVLLNMRTEVEALILRTPGMLYQEQPDGYISSLYNYQVINKTTDAMPLEFVLDHEGGRLRLVGQMPAAAPGEMVKGAFFIDLPAEQLDSRKEKIFIDVYSGGRRIERVKTNFLGPIQ